MTQRANIFNFGDLLKLKKKLGIVPHTITLALWKLRQKDCCECEANLGQRVRPCLKTNEQINLCQGYSALPPY